MRLSGRVGAALAESLGRETGSDLAASESANFIVLHPAGDARRAGRMLEMLEATRSGFLLAFADQIEAPATSDPLVWIVFNQRNDFDAYALMADRVDMSWSQAYYSSRTNRVAFLDDSVSASGPVRRATAQALSASGAGTVMPAEADGQSRRLSQMTHEAVHQLSFNCGLQRRGVMYPLWASEGLAANFEADEAARVGPDRPNPYRERRFREAIVEGRLSSVEAMLATSRVPVGDERAVDDAYAHAWAFFRFLYLHRRPQLGDYYERIETQRPGLRTREELREDFVSAFGSPAVIQAQWERYCLDLVAPTGE